MQCVSSTSISIDPSLTLVGRSRAGDGTTFWIPSLEIIVDCGALPKGCEGKQPALILMTHTHSDHVTWLTRYTHIRSNTSTKKKVLSIYMPHRAVSFVDDYLAAYGKMITMDTTTDNSDDEKNQSDVSNSRESYQLVGLEPHQTFELTIKGTHLHITAIECVHRVDCLGYSIWQQRQILKDDYRSLAGQKIGQLRKQGVEITTTTLKPLLCYLGDTTAEVFLKHPEILQQHTKIMGPWFIVVFRFEPGIINI